MSGAPIDVTVNGEAHRLPADTTVAELLALLAVTGGACAVELNRQVLPRSRHAEQRLDAGDRVEIVTFVGGG